MEVRTFFGLTPDCIRSQSSTYTNPTKRNIFCDIIELKETSKPRLCNISKIIELKTVQIASSLEFPCSTLCEKFSQLPISSTP